MRSLGLFSTAPATAVRVSRALVPSLAAAVTAALLTVELDSDRGLQAAAHTA